MWHWTDHAARVGAAAGLLAAFLFMAFVTTASAAPTLSANPTVVTVGYGSASKGKTTLTWSSGTAQSVQVHVRIDSGAFVPTGLSGPSGSGDYTNVEYGHTYLFRLFGPNGEFLQSSATAIVTVKHGQINLNFGCVAQCIQSASVEPHGTYANFTATTVVDATFLVQAFAAPPKSDGTCPSAPLAGTLWKSTPSKTFSGQMIHLEAGKDHCYTVTAKDANGNEQKVHKTFKTLRRFATVTVETIHIINDSDSGGAGEIHFGVGFYLPGGNQPMVEDLSAVLEKDLDDGNDVHPNKPYTIANAPTAVEIRVSGWDDDGPFDTTEGAIAIKVLDVGGPGGPGEVISTPQTFKVNSSPFVYNPDSDLSFRVEGSFTVTYAP
jgi:hypothetical protein